VLKLRPLDVVMSVPAGALEGQTAISLGVSWNKADAPLLASNQSLVSPVIVCEPTKITFLKPVAISFPHCAGKETPGHTPRQSASQSELLKSLSVMQSKTATGSPTSWDELSDEDFVTLTTSRCTLLTKHFCLYAVVDNQPQVTNVL
jgi:hypothetical protein